MDNKTFVSENGKVLYRGDSSLGEIEVLCTEPVFHNRFTDVVNDIVRFPGGNEGTYLRISFPYNDSVGVLPVTEDGRMVLIRTFRHGVRAWGYEIPKGGVGYEEEAEAAAIRETYEETGYTCGGLTYVGEYSDSPAICQGLMKCYIARDCKLKDHGAVEETEAISGSVLLTPREYFALMDKPQEHMFRDAVTEMMVYRYMSDQI